MAGEWESASLSELCEQIADCPHSTPLWTDSGVIVLRNQNIRDGRLDLSSPSYTDELNFEQRSRRARLKAGDLVLTREAPMGEVCMVPENLRCCLGQRMVMLRPDPKKCDSRFLLYSIQSDVVQHEIKVNEGTGSTVSNLRIPLLEALPIPLPPLAEQKAIAGVLGALDDKIELNRRMNATLESMARALFQSWFVDFDPVRAKLDGRQPVGMDEETAALFPDSFEQSPIGPIPVGWKVERLDSHISADRGLSYKGEGLCDDHTGMPMHNLNSIFEGGGYKHQGIKYYKGEYREKHIVDPGDMIVTNTEQGFDHLLIGHAAVVPRCFGLKGIYSHHIYRVRFMPSSPFNPHYLVELFNNRRWHYWISGFSNGTTINMLPIDALEMPLLVVPPKDLVMQFTAIARSAHDQIEDNLQQSRTLATLRDTLLPKLLSGELSLALDKNRMF
jgi:type I restriction enzyme S subunit